MLDWRDQALCRGKHTDIWFPPILKSERTAPESQYNEIAKMVCDACPVHGKCRLDGLEEELGVWGGWTRKEEATGHFKPSKRVISPHYALKVIPDQTADVRVNVPELRETLKRYTDKRA